MNFEFKNKDVDVLFRKLEAGAVFRYNSTYFKDDIYMKLPSIKDKSDDYYNAFKLTDNTLAWFSDDEVVQPYKDTTLLIG